MDTSHNTGPDLSPLSLRWQRAAMLGSLWAANEIVLGSFLHNVGIPFAGTILACIGVTLLVAGLCLWDDPGVIWRAGVICSLMKSISPSSVILGPMIGILTEAVLIYFFVVAFRRTSLGCILGGIAAAVTPLVQKVISIIIAYGMDAARMYENLFSLFSERLQFRSLDAREALLLLIAAQAVPGALAAVAGIAIARRARSVPPTQVSEIESGSGDSAAFQASSQRYSIPALFLHFAVILAGLALIPALPQLLTPIPVAVYLLAVLYWYPGVRPKFKRARLWLEFAGVAILAGVLLGVLAPGGKSTWWTGLQSGVVMVSRATLVITAFSAISIELRNPVVVNWFLERGLGTVSAALHMAFRALPAMTQSLNQGREWARHPLRAFSSMLAFMLAQLGETPRDGTLENSRGGTLENSRVSTPSNGPAST